MFAKVLIANRGEIAVRIARSLREMGITVVAVHSDPDAGAPHVDAADEAYALPGETSAETYLRGDAILEIAGAHGVDAIHPGYGFLSENAAFAEACGEAGVTFIGPPPAAIRAMGDKILAKEMMADAGVPVLPGWSGDVLSLQGGGADELRPHADAIGYPLLVKAAAGGGGKGMRIVREPKELADALAAAQREAGAAFGDARVFLEKYLQRARHVEVQVFGDTHGNVLHCFERECSVQRRHQKIIEEAPAPGLDDRTRAAMGEAAVAAARALGYTNAGTVEFMLGDDGAFHFLEVNTRLQVEHPVTELTIGHDLVREQVRVAAGEPLSFTAASLAQSGSAIECRIYAEDAARGFLPSTGTILLYEPPIGPGIRVDSGVRTGSVVSVHYDPMLAKLCVWDRDRDAARRRMVEALGEFVVLGVTTNIPFLRAVLEHEAFAAGDLDTRFLEHHAIGVEAASASDEAAIVAALAARRGAVAGRATGSGPTTGPWERVGAWRGLA